MSNTVNVNLNVSSNGTLDNENKKAEKLNKTLTTTQRLVSSQKAKPSAMDAADPDFDYRQARAGRGTGAGARDFAKQAEGLGGLVRVYATFAANVFAVTAAFQALSKAADYTNMVKGLDQLGAASGRNLGYMAQQVAKITDNAVSMKEAMTAVAQASSAGMSSDQIERMSLVAKQASQALGRDMVDSLNRISRGITKLEPELLDEIGIFVRVDKAATDYARTIGKTALSLTDFERRQAFAIAAIEQAEQKFGAIKLDANPYSKLQASVVDLLYSGGELLNKVLGPIASTLANSPTALGAGLVAIIGLLTKQAIPAIADFRKGLRDSAEETAKTAEEYVKRAQASRMQNLDAYRAAAEAEAEASQQALEKIATKQSLKESTKGKSKLAGWVKDILDNPNAARDVTEAQLENIDKLAEKRNKLTGELTKNAEAYAKISANLKAAKQAEENYDLVVSKIQEERARRASPFTAEGMNQRIADRATRDSLASNVLSKTADATNVGGFAGGWVALKEGIKDAKDQAAKGGTAFSKLGEGLMYARGGAAILATQITKVISTLGWVAMAIAAAVAGFQMLNSWLSKSAKEQEAFNDSRNRLEKGIEGLSKTLDVINEKDFLGELSVESILARATALGEIGSAANKLVKDFERVEAAQRSWDNFTDWVSSLWGGSNQQKLDKDMATAVQSALDALPDNISGDKARKAINAAVATKDNKKIAKALEKETGDMTRQANNLKGAMDSLSEASKSYNDAVNSLTPNDNISKIAISSAKGMYELSSSIVDADSALSAFIEVTGSLDKLKLLPEDMAIKFLEARKQIEPLQNALKEIDTQSERLSKSLKEYNETQQDLPGFLEEDTSAAGQKAKSEQSQLAKLDTARQELRSQIEKVLPDLEGGFSQAADKAVDKLTLGYKVAAEKAALSYSKALMQVVPGESAEAIKYDEELKKKEIDLGLSQIKVQQELIMAQERLRLVMEEMNLTAREREGDPLAKGLLEQLRITKNIIAPAEGRAPNMAEAVKQLKATKGNMYSTGILAADAGFQAQQAEASGKKREAALQSLAEQKKLETKQALERLSEAEALLAVEKERIDLGISLTQGYSEELLLQKQQVTEKERALKISQIDEKIQGSISLLQIGLSKATSEQEKRVMAANYASEQTKLQAERTKVVEEQKVKIYQDQLDLISAKAKIEASLDELYSKGLDISNSLIDIGEQSGAILKSEAILLKANNNAAAQRRTVEREIAELRDKALLKDTDPRVAASLSSQADIKQNILNMTLAQIDAEAKYQAGLLQTEETLKRLEEAGSYNSEYFSAASNDFNNKITELVKASKSAASAFNEGFIGAIDSSIDKFFDMLQKSEFTMKDMISFIRNSLSDVFRDTASQVLKDTWKRAVSGFMGQSDPQEKATEAMGSLVLALQNNTAALQGRTGIMGPPESLKNSPTGLNSLPSSVNREFGSNPVEDNFKDLSNSADTQGKASKGFFDSVKGMGSAVMDFVDGSATFTQSFGRIVDNFGNLMPSLFNGIYGVIAGAFGGGGGGGKQSFGELLLGSVVKGVVGWATGGFGAAAGSTAVGPVTGTVDWASQSVADMNWLEGFKKGGIFAGSPSLSAYSNSIVTSPTTFAFAKGAGIMGEAGPEAIIPLKRDNQGNLGVGGTAGSTNNNNVEINITVEGGTYRDTNSNANTQNSMANQLGAAIKAAVSEELVKQSRPGGLLSKR